MNSCSRAECSARLSALQKRRGEGRRRAEQGREDDSGRITDRATVRKGKISEQGQNKWAKINLRLSGHFIDNGYGSEATDRSPIFAGYSRNCQ